MYENPSPQPSRLPIVLASVFALTTLVAGIIAATGYAAASRERATVQAQVDRAVEAARADQKAKDAEEHKLAMQTPFRSYVAPVAAGSFEIKFPKSWSGSVVETTGGRDQVSLTLGEEFVRSVDSKTDPVPARVVLRRASLDLIFREYNDHIKRGKLKLGELTVSGLQGKQLTGEFADKRTVRLVAIPIRDKTLVFTSEDKKFSREFEQILAQSKINP